MSDFGTTIKAKKADDSKFSSAEMSQLSIALKNIIEEGEYGDTIGQKFNNEFQYIDGDPDETIIVMLSEAYYGDSESENEEIRELVEEVELPQAEEIIEQLRESFPEYDFICEVEDW